VTLIEELEFLAGTEGGMDAFSKKYEEALKDAVRFMVSDRVVIFSQLFSQLVN